MRPNTKLVDQCVVLRYVVETWDSEEAEWVYRYERSPAYQYASRAFTTGHLWWKRKCKEWFITEGRQARRRALRRAVKRAERLLDAHTVRIVSVSSVGGLSPLSHRVIWTDGEFIFDAHTF